MALNFSNFETALQAKLDTITDEKDMLLLGKAIEATVGNVAVSDLQTEGSVQKAAVAATGSTEVSAVQAQGTSERNQINAMSSGFATSSSLATVATSGNFNDLSNQPAPFDAGTLASVATSGSFNDLSNKPQPGGLLKTHYWQDRTHRSFGTGGIYVLSNTFAQVGSNSKFIIDCGIVVGAGDNVSGHIQLYYNGGWHTTTYRGQSAYQDNNNSSWGDLAHRHEDGMPLKQHAKFVWQPNVTGTIGVRMYIQAENGTRYINRRNGWGSAPNSISGFSSITIQETTV
jgi:hypothetical protein